MPGKEGFKFIGNILISQIIKISPIWGDLEGAETPYPIYCYLVIINHLHG